LQFEMQRYVISLQRTPERLTEFRRINKTFSNYEIFEGIDGEIIELNSLVANEVINHSVDYTRGAVGSALSHMELWKIVRNRGEAATILEDDAILHSRFEENLTRLISNLEAEGADWDIVFWGWNFDSVLVAELVPKVSNCIVLADQNALRRNFANYGAVNVTTNLYKLHNLFGTMCYSISPRGAERLLHFTLPIKETKVFVPGLNRTVKNTSIDIMMNGLYSKIDAFIAFPPLALVFNNHGTSTVRSHETW
jgi:glycosyl transferase, family 25